MRKHKFRPSLNDVLEDRLALSQSGAGIVHAAVAHPNPTPSGHPVLRAGAVNDVNRQIDVAFAKFNREYKKEVVLKLGFCKVSLAPVGPRHGHRVAQIV